MRKIIDCHYRRQKSGPVSLWTNELTLDARLSKILASLHAPRDKALEPLKQSLRRCVLRVNHFSDKHPTIIVKGFPLQKIESRLKYRKYGLAEAANYLQAQTHGIPTPACYGYFEHRSLGTVKSNGVLIEDLNGYQTLHDLAEQNPQQSESILARAIPIITLLYQKGVNHIDTTAHNLMESPDGDKIVVIDWQYATFTQAPNTQQLILQAVQFLRYTAMTDDTPEWENWLKGLHTSCNPDMDWQSFRENVRILQSKKRADNKARLNLSVELPV